MSHSELHVRGHLFFVCTNLLVLAVELVTERREG